MDRFFIYGYRIAPYVIRYLGRLGSGLPRCVHGVFDLGCILVNYRLYTRLETPAGTLFSPFPSPRPHTCLPSTCLYPYSSDPLPRFPSCGSNIRFTLLCCSLAPRTRLFDKSSPVSYLSFIRHPCFVFSCSSRRFRPSEFFLSRFFQLNF